MFTQIIVWKKTKQKKQQKNRRMDGRTTDKQTDRRTDRHTDIQCETVVLWQDIKMMYTSVTPVLLYKHTLAAC